MSDAYHALRALTVSDAPAAITAEIQVQIRTMLDDHTRLISDNARLQTRITALEPADFAILTATQLASLTTAQFAALETADVAGLSTTQLAALSTSQLYALDPEDLRAMSTTQLVALTTAQIRGLQPSDFAALSTAQISAFSTAQLCALSADQIRLQAKILVELRDVLMELGTMECDSRDLR